MVGNYTKLTLLYVVLSRVTAGGGGRNYTHDYSCVVMYRTRSIEICSTYFVGSITSLLYEL